MTIGTLLAAALVILVTFVLGHATGYVVGMRKHRAIVEYSLRTLAEKAVRVKNKDALTLVEDFRELLSIEYVE